jgi:hypothetical protein
VKGKVFLTVVLLCGFLAGCAHDRRAWTSEDGWYNPHPSGTRLAEWEPLEHGRIHEVSEGQRAAAEDLLREASYVVLTPDQAADLLGQSLPSVAGTQPVLVRGLVLNRATGGFSVYVLEDRVTVYHRCLGRSAVPMTRQPLVLQLERPPTTVYVAVSMAE